MQEAVSPGTCLNRIRDQIDWYDAKACWNHKRFRTLQAVVIVLSALTPLLLAVGLIFSPVQPRWDRYVLALLPILVSVGATVFTALLTTFKYQETWVQYRDTCERLRRERMLYESGAGEYSEAGSPERLLARRAEEIMAGEGAVWLSLMSERSE